MRYKMLGKTGFKVSELGFGGIPIMAGRCKDFLVELKDIGEKEAIETVYQAYKNGINFFDTAVDYGDSEEKIGEALKTVRKDVIIASKSKALTYDQMKRDVYRSLNKLGMEYIDLYQLHYVRDTYSYATIMDEENGAYRALSEFKSSGIIRSIGIASHNPYVLMPAVQSNRFSTIQMPVNLIEQECNDLIQIANEKKLGIIAMKPYAGGTLTKSLPKTKNLNLTDRQMKRLALSYVLSTDISVAIPGIANRNELHENLEIYKEKEALLAEDFKNMNIIQERLGKTFCRRCQYCEPCPQGIEIAKILRIVKYYEDYDLKGWAKEQYSNISEKGSKCVKCGKCETKCPYNLKISSEIERIDKLLA